MLTFLTTLTVLAKSCLIAESPWDADWPHTNTGAAEPLRMRVVNQWGYHAHLRTDAGNIHA